MDRISFIPVADEGAGAILGSLTMNARNIIGGKYRLKQKIGEGAMGVVWAAVNQQTLREVAIKLILSEDDQLRHRLIREARACGQLSHRNIIEVLDAGMTEDHDPYLVMPLLDGETLLDLLKRKRRLEPAVVVQIARDIAKALTAAHAANIVHRDLKPANIYLHKEPGADAMVVKVMDFGICKRLESKDEKLTATGKVIGSPSYMSPEQFAPAKGIDHRTDIWSLGIIMFEMLTGERPFQGDRMKVILNIIDTDIEIPRISKLVRFVPPALVDLIADCLVREREQRIGAADELVERLQAIASSGDIGDAHREAGRRGSLASTPALLSAEIVEPSLLESEAPAAVAQFPRSLDDSSIITLPQGPGPRKVAARRRPPGASPPALMAEPVVKEVEEETSGTDESTLLDVRFARPRESGSEIDLEDLEATTPFRVPHSAAVKVAPAVVTPEIASLPEAPTPAARPRDVPAARPRDEAYPMPLSGSAIPFDALGPIGGPADLPPWTTADLYGAFTGTRWVPKRVRSITPRMAIIGGMAIAATLLLAFGFVAAAGGSPASEPETPAKPQIASRELATLAPPAASAASAPLTEPAVAPTPSAAPTATAAPRVGSVRAQPPVQRPKPPQPSKGASPPPPKCQGKLIKKC
jgi:serine/threonine-protein kinase